MQQLQAELQDLSHQDATLGQQIEQYQQATNRAKEELGKLRWPTTPWLSSSWGGVVEDSAYPFWPS